MGPKPRPPIDRFMEKVDKRPGGCWLWTAACFDSGYGAFRDGPKQRRAHRWAYEHFVGTLPADAVVMHSCDVPQCVNPRHLRLGTHDDNVQDRVRKGRSAVGRRAGAVTHPIKLNPAAAAQIREIYAAGGVSQMALAAQFGVSQTIVGRIVRGEAWPADRY